MSPADRTSQRNRALQHVVNVLLLTVAVFWLVLATPNVPGALTADGEITDFAAVLWLIGILAWGTVFFRHRLPVVTLGAGLLLAVVGLEYLLLLLGAYHAALTWRPPARTWLAWAVPAAVVLFWVREAFTGFGGALTFFTAAAPNYAVGISAVLACLSLAVTFGLTVLAHTKRQALGERERANVEQTHAARLGEELSRQSERAQIARDIHDNLTNRLALVSMMSGNLEKAVGAGDPDAAGLALDIQAQARHALADLRTLIGDLRTEPSAPASQQASMSSLGDLITATRAAGTKVDALVLINGPYNVHPELDAAVFRLVQEGLTNAVKHAPGETVSLYLDASPANGVRLRISNSLRRTDVAAALVGPRSGMGLAGMRERVAVFGGTTWTGEHKDEFLIDITIPWHAADAVLPGVPAPTTPGGPTS